MHNNIKPYCAVELAHYFINQSAITHFKLQNLIYITHGVCLAYFKRPLIKQQIESWPHGPIIVEVYRAFKNYGESIIPKDNKVIHKDENTHALIEAVCTKYKNYTETDLSKLTRKANTPWSDVYGTGKVAIIDNDIIRRYYQYKLDID